ncbi:hypothetical protein D9Q98_006345 [Chlorella vulgaris]|uniref:Uncharacterized protein n=1 Tax=Chlorella vulgaris TaxID=3077 RepID=A0A9D4TK83_CHLVU|nr:hypothetical protein D9Q98_006345 [Chlorella vulgaris]
MQQQGQRQQALPGTAAAAGTLAVVTGTAAQQRWTFRVGCTRCVCCVDLRRHRHSAQSAARSAPVTASTPEEWWPAGLSTPTIYFHLRRRQLHLQYKQATTSEGAAKTWRPASETRNGACALLEARRCRPLGLLVPAQWTNVSQIDDAVQLVGVKTVQLSVEQGPQPLAGAAASAPRQLPVPPQQQQQAAQQHDLQAAVSVLAACADVLPRANVQATPALIVPKRSVPDLCAALLSPAKRHKGALSQPALWPHPPAAPSPSFPSCLTAAPGMCLHPSGSSGSLCLLASGNSSSSLCLPASGASSLRGSFSVPTPADCLPRERLLEMKAERAFPVGQVVVDLGEVVLEGGQRTPSLFSSLLRLLTGN